MRVLDYPTYLRWGFHPFHRQFLKHSNKDINSKRKMANVLANQNSIIGVVVNIHGRAIIGIVEVDRAL